MIIILNPHADLEARDALKKTLDNHQISYQPLHGEDYEALHVVVQNKDFEQLQAFATYEAVEKIIPLNKPYYKKRETAYLRENYLTQYTKNEAPFMIAGPCSIENETQLRTIAKAVKKSGAHALRGGAYKPRTSPYSFQGLGLAGLKILHKIAKEFDMPCVSEIVSVNDIEAFIQYVDIIQVGARNMQNYELLKVLAKTTKPIILKRGFGNTVEEWLSSAEYLLKDGNENIILCERGIRTFDPQIVNVLDLNGMLLAKRLTHLPIIVDPSHAAGDYRYVGDLSKAAIAAGAQGLMIEVHTHPSQALSDGKQSLKPEKYDEIASLSRVLYKNNMSH